MNYEDIPEIVSAPTQMNYEDMPETAASLSSTTYEDPVDAPVSQKSSADEGVGFSYEGVEEHFAEPKGSSSAYLDTDAAETVTTYSDAIPEVTNNKSNSAPLPDFLVQDQMLQRQLEAKKKKLYYMQYHPSPLLPLVMASVVAQAKELSGDWNERFQVLIDKEDGFEKYDNLRSTANDFVYAAESYGRIIIAEMCLPDADKTIKPLAIGGIAGGQKFIVQDILFKFAIDFEGIYGGDQFAMKAAGHEISGLMAYMNAIQVQPRAKALLHVPMMALIDFRGYRLTAMCLLPVGKNTICYGSFDAGRTVHYTYPDCNEAMKEVGEFLNIRGHRSPNSASLIYAPIDIEAHRGRDGKFYVLDFARYMPPQPPSGKWGSTLYELLRPELVSSSPVPLSPDAFSSFGHPDDRQEFQNDIVRVFQTLTRPGPGGIVFEYARLIDTVEKTESEINESSNLDNVEAAVELQEVLVRELHSRGINIRWLGLLRSFCNLPKIRLFLLQQCLARLWKCEMQHIWRDLTRNERSPSEEPFRKVTANFLNMILKEPEYWSTLKSRLAEKFPSILSEEEQRSEFDLRTQYPGLFVVSLFQWVSFTQVFLERTTSKALLAACMEGKAETFSFVAGDIVRLGTRTRHVSLIDKSDAYANMYQAQTLKKTDERTARRLLDLALVKLQSALKSSGGSDLDLHYRLCQCRLEVFSLQIRSDPSSVNAARVVCQDTLTAFAKKLGLLPHTALLSKVLLLSSKLNYQCAALSLRLEDFEIALQSSWKVFDTFEAFVTQARLPAYLAGPELLSIVKHMWKVLTLLQQKESWLSSTDVHESLDQVIRRGIQGCMSLSNTHPSPRVSFMMWFFLLKYAQLEAHLAVIPSHAIGAIFSDSCKHLSDALMSSEGDARILSRLRVVLESKDFSVMLPLLGLSECSNAAFAELIALASQWSEYNLRKAKLWHADVHLARLVAHSGTLVKLRLREMENVSSAAMTMMLNSASIQANLELLEFPSVTEGSFGFLLNEVSEGAVFLKLVAVGFRHTPVTNQVLGGFLKRHCPALRKLDVSDSDVDVSSLSTFVPLDLVKLDIGFPRSDCKGDALCALAVQLVNLEVLGLAATKIGENHLDSLFQSLKALRKLDLCKCAFILDHEVQSRLYGSSHPAGLTDVWLPSGAWFPCFPVREEIQVKASGSLAHMRKRVFVAREKPFAEMRDCIHGKEFWSHPTPGMRSLHLRMLGTVNESKQAMLTNGSPFKFFPDGNKDSGKFDVVGNFGGPMPVLFNRSPTSFDYEFTFQSEKFRIVGRVSAFKKKIDSFTIYRLATNESSECRCSSGFSRPDFKWNTFIGVSPYVFAIAVEILMKMAPTEMGDY